MSGPGPDKPEAPETPREEPREEVGLVKFRHGETADAVEVKLSPRLVQLYINPTATKEEALAFIAFCRDNRLNPYTRECYLVRYDQNEPAQPVVAYDVLMKRASKQPTLRGFRAGLVLWRKDEAMPAVKGVQGLIEEPFVATEGALVYPGHELFGAWCQVYRSDRELPTTVVIQFSEYVKRKRGGGEPTRFWASMPATMIRKSAVSRGFHDAYSELFAGWVTDAEATREPLPTKVIDMQQVEASLADEERDTWTVPLPLVALFEKLGWNKTKMAMWLGQHRDVPEAKQAELLQALAGVRAAPEPAGEDGRDQQQAVELDAVGGPPGHGQGGAAGQGLHLNEERPRALHSHQDG